MTCKMPSVRSPLSSHYISIYLLNSYAKVFFRLYIFHQHLDKFYVGHTQNLTDRIYRHNNSGSKSTKSASDWTLVYTEQFSNRSAAYKRELEIEKKKSRMYIENLISDTQL